MVDIIIYPNFPDWKPRHREIIYLAQDYTVPVVINYVSRVSAQFGSKIHVLNNEPNLSSSILATSTVPHSNTHTYTHLPPLPTIKIVVSLLGVKSVFGVYYYYGYLNSYHSGYVQCTIVTFLYLCNFVFLEDNNFDF